MHELLKGRIAGFLRDWQASRPKFSLLVSSRFQFTDAGLLHPDVSVISTPFTNDDPLVELAWVRLSLPSR